MGLISSAATLGARDTGEMLQSFVGKNFQARILELAKPSSKSQDTIQMSAHMPGFTFSLCSFLG